ncbi:uncharacterized protein N7500_001570 [Penicillium coprophilum]|uniref:uncharacterized protein n=1 Tax=Penicillium coprophilum TaxID=36646 RepID=UPI0023A02F18|nr:uncharacterized protein N7500_001570 [Penicillium coprophilum]KAJ5173639.1 hypothetical protein N7500_001570 [Penicillium coprophilum]
MGGKTASVKLSPLWERALETYHEDLAGDEDFRKILETGSLEELLADDQVLQPLGSQGRQALDTMTRLRPTFKLLNDFSVVLAMSLGAGTAVTALVWGSIRMILTLASTADNVLQEVSDMLEELTLTLPRLKFYEKTVSMDTEMETSLLTVYQEVICFYARAIHFFRTNKHSFLLRSSWSDLRGDFQRTIKRIKRLSNNIESEVELTRMRIDNQKYHEVLDLMANFQPQRLEPTHKVSHYLPFAECSRFWGRDDFLNRIDEVLFAPSSASSLRSFALYGMGGAGKTQIALRYANSSREKFDAIFWVSADNLVTIGQSFREIARTLKLIQVDTETDDHTVMLKVKQWLSSTNTRWLLIYDNADDLTVIKHAWPTGSVGSVLITSRDSTAAFSIASSGCQVTPFDTENGSAALLSIIGLDPESPSHLTEAKAITSTLGGLPLALNQIGGFIMQRKIPLKNFLALYNRNSASVDAKGLKSMDYSHTLATVWEMSLSQLSGNANILHMILSFLDPDYIHEALLVDGAVETNDSDLEFVTDEIDFLDAQEVLIQGALIDKSIESGIISMHRLVQRAVIRRMSVQERERIFSLAVTILAANFPDTYSADVGHQAASWALCERSLPHIESVVSKGAQFKLFEKGNQAFAELLLRCSWYLYERENYTLARSYVDVAVKKFVINDSLAYASAVDLRGLIELDMCHPAVALEAFEQAYALRTAILSSNDPFLAANQVNLGLAFTEMGQLDKAYEYLQQSIDIRLLHKSDRIGNSYSNMASLLLKMGKPDDAEAMLKSCPSLKDFSDETFLKTGNPRFSGDMVLLSRIRVAQGLSDEALRFASKALSFRKECLSQRLKVCDSLYQVSVLLHEGGNLGLAHQLLEECIKISEALPQAEGVGHLARANYKMSQVLHDLGKHKESTMHLEKAVNIRDELRKLDGDYVLVNGADADFDDLVPWMLW